MKKLTKNSFIQEWITDHLPDEKWEKAYNKAEGELNALIEYEIEDYKEFVRWLVFGDHPFVASCDFDEDDNLVEYFTDELSAKRWSLDELYEYWKS